MKAYEFIVDHRITEKRHRFVVFATTQDQAKLWFFKHREGYQIVCVIEANLNMIYEVK